jgi:hypothetical protein
MSFRITLVFVAILAVALVVILSLPSIDWIAIAAS